MKLRDMRIRCFARGRLSIPLAVVALLSGLIMGGLGMGSASAHTKPHKSTTSPSTRIAVATCPTTYGVSGQVRGDVPTTEPVSLPKQLRKNLTLLTDSKRSLVPLLAPRGWHCSVQVGADGSSSLAVYPGKKAPARSGVSNAEEIVATTDGACQGCIADTVCAYFVNAQTQIGYTGSPCNTSKPKNERDDYVSGSSSANHGQVDTYTPPSRRSRYGTYGVLRYLLASQGGAEDAHETCALPRDRSTWCQYMIKEFVTDNWGFTPSASPTSTATATPPSSIPATTTTATPPPTGPGGCTPIPNTNSCEPGTGNSGSSGPLTVLPTTTSTSTPVDPALVQWANNSQPSCTGAEDTVGEAQQKAGYFPGTFYYTYMYAPAQLMVSNTQQCISFGPIPDQSSSTQQAWAAALKSLLADGQELVASINNDTSPATAIADAETQVATMNSILVPIYTRTAGACVTPGTCTP